VEVKPAKPTKKAKAKKAKAKPGAKKPKPAGGKKGKAAKVANGSLEWWKDEGGLLHAQDGGDEYVVYAHHSGNGFAASKRRPIKSERPGAHKRLQLGGYETLERARAVCEQHYASGGSPSDHWERQ
jgi:hypothetical protein